NPLEPFHSFFPGMHENITPFSAKAIRRVIPKKDRRLAIRSQANYHRDIFGNPSRPVTFSPEWRIDTAVSLARQMYNAREFSAMPILAAALQDSGVATH